MLVYEAVNELNGKVYIGITTETLKKRMSSHLRSAKSNSNSYFHKAIRKYGEDSFKWSVICRVKTLENPYKMEKMIIALYEDWQTYNVSAGGEHSAYGMKHTDETKKLCGEYARRRWDGLRAVDKYPIWALELPTYKEAKLQGIPKTTYYRYRRNKNLT